MLSDSIYAEIGKLALAFNRGTFFRNPDDGKAYFCVHRSPKVHTTFCLQDCNTRDDVVAKVLEWLSRDAYKSIPFHNDYENNKYHEYVRNGISKYVGKLFTFDDMREIYTYIGNRIDHQRTIDFIQSGFDVKALVDKMSKVRSE